MAPVSDLKEIRSIIALYIDALKRNQISPQQVFLFGSFAKGSTCRDSDIDLAIVSKDLSGDPIDDFVRLMKFRRGIDLRIEPHPFLPEDFEPDNPEVAEIMRTGVRIV